MAKYVHPHVRQLADDKKVSTALERIVKAFTALRENERVSSCMTSEDNSELYHLQERIQVIHAKYLHPR